MMLLQEEIEIPAGDFSFFLFFCCFFEISKILWRHGRDRVKVTIKLLWPPGIRCLISGGRCFRQAPPPQFYTCSSTLVGSVSAIGTTCSG